MKHSILFLFLVTGLVVKSQNIEVVNTALNFADATEINGSTETITIYNPGIYPIDISGIDLFELYSDEPFYANDTAFRISPQDTLSITVQFLPEHNIDHEMSLVIKTSTGFGHVAVNLTGQGKYSNTYYNSTENLEGAALKTALNNRLSLNYNSLGYKPARDNMYASIDNDGGQVECVYTGRTASFTTRSGANSNNFNCEHTYPQGHFNKNEPMRSDIHHLFPTDVSANSTRGNDPFGMVNNPSWSQGGSKSGGGKFEPRDVQKGPTARAMMYFVLRYQDYSNFFQSQENILYQWHGQFPPDSAEKARNEEIFTLQNNRNPFVDYPQFMERITSLVSSTSAPVVKDLYLSDDTIKLAQRAGRYVYHFVVYNTGNSNLTLTNFSLTDTSLHFEQGRPSSLVIGPHQSETIEISFNSSTEYQGEFLDFDTDISGMSDISVPISSGAKIGLPETKISGFDIYPNPAETSISISGYEDMENVWMTDISGKQKLMDTSENGTIDLREQTPGIYMLSIILENGNRISRKLIVK